MRRSDAHYAAAHLGAQEAKIVTLMRDGTTRRYATSTPCAIVTYEARPASLDTSL